ncbi:MAG: flagellar hook assembly protein FlgD [Rhizobiales bacterium]|nr:flagellar hook assembly protein FlgD [Hyphomicrobiales bacterium]MBO6700307.1 flagellar hook assembly protein FlgD [Hyphomicrobiales bacterium]MBO6737528.1 flagellar hook assembly protein FlgD [Hyphomicrobiales bacterium]MBO6913415.1 flagellar hook assembly protein FlgD [Hyphomicrobiales bacterium]MBO6955346.1 flagellar hook assembly protein FlgD [Hyphomicrobiales bacterium]
MSTLDQLAAASQASVQQANAQRDQQMLADDFDTFLQLLTTQLRNQDPLEPMDTNQFTQQLVQFSGVEQQIQTNSYLENLITSTEAQSVNAAVNYLGSTVTVAGVSTTLDSGQASWELVSGVAAPDSTISIYDVNGNEIFTTKHAVDRGESTFTWDGKTNDGTDAPDGVYSIRVVGNTSDGQAVNVYAAVTGKVTGVDFTGSEPVLQIGDVRANLSSVMEIQAPTS